MESRENPLFGRKIFFVNPTFNIEKYLIDYLRKNEYEVYILKEYKKVKRVLSVYPDSMCFIDIDEQLSYSEWYNYMKSFSLIPELQGIYLGIVTQNATWEDKDKFLMNVRLPCGFTLISKQEKILEHFAAILDLNGAKGRRKYLRLDTRNEKDVSGYMTSEGKLYTINIKDISSVGFAITYKQELMSMFQKNTLLRNLCLSAGRKSMVCSCIVFNTQVNPDGTAMSVLMLTNENPESTKTYIRDYIFQKFDEKMNTLIANVEKDDTRYNQSDEYSQLHAVRDRDYGELETVDALEPLEEEGEAEVKFTGSNIDDDIL
ncbi:hypothetical protein SAMN04487775_10312 [Treponema bryantii]|uniref:PilZ domain-containing protein n=1 Tax=Treponema bryantii TaxID=163 RepID=A0A1I3JGT4_9SPIR|nr:hypothetical protein [Treponema bryantii]SFI59135.1 hypothetical protein SAMN04487775_10312 [Treponema bryantii]